MDQQVVFGKQWSLQASYNSEEPQLAGSLSSTGGAGLGGGVGWDSLPVLVLTSCFRPHLGRLSSTHWTSQSRRPSCATWGRSPPNSTMSSTQSRFRHHNKWTLCFTQWRLREKKSLLKEWDLWGPLILCTLMATILQVFLVLAVRLIIPNKSFDLKSDSRGTAQRIASAMGAQNLRKFL